MTPNILKTGKTFGQSLDSSTAPQNMDGDHSGKAMDQGANSATKGAQDFTEGIHEGAAQTVRHPS